MKLFSIIILLGLSVLLTASDKPIALRHNSSFKIRISEPSDVCLKPDGTGYFVVSDNGLLYETDNNWQITRQSPHKGYDYEGVYADKEFVYVVEERTRKVLLFDPVSLELVRRISTPYQGGRNKGFESLTWNEQRQRFVMVTEKDPVVIYEYDKDFRYAAEYDFKSASDISSATYYNGKIYILSDEERTIFELDATTYKILRSWKLKILNPEGMVFSKEGNLFVISDDLERVYAFGQLQ
jgi:uncharacterized protein YjiK